MLNIDAAWNQFHVNVGAIIIILTTYKDRKSSNMQTFYPSSRPGQSSNMHGFALVAHAATTKAPYKFHCIHALYTSFTVLRDAS